MSAGCAKSPQGRRLVRKSVPDGSSDFQRALDHLLSSSESDNSGLSNDEGDSGPADESVFNVLNKGTSKLKYIIETGKNVSTHGGSKEELYECDLNGDVKECNENTSPQKNSDRSKYLTKKLRTSPNSDSLKCSLIKDETARVDDNNNVRQSICTCERWENWETFTFTDFKLRQPIPKHAWDTSPEEKSLSSPSNNYSECSNTLQKKSRPPPLKLPSITAHLSKSEPTHLSGMGINCSANIGDAKEFSNVLTDGTPTSTMIKKQSKLGGLLTKRNASIETEDPLTMPSDSDHCSCSHHEDGKKNASHVSTVKSGHQEQSLSDHTKITKRSSSLPGKFSKTASSSPQRLLTSRNRSPNGYLRSCNSVDSGGDMRTRSHSWSNGRCMAQTRQGPVRPITKTSSLFPRAVASALVGTPQSHLPHQCEAASERKSLSSSATNTNLDLDCTLPRLRSHQPGCPLYAPSDNGRTGPALNLPRDEQDHGGSPEPDLMPEQRPRAASESHTSLGVRPRRLLSVPRPRSNTMSVAESRTSPNSDLDHGVHVHWADEEQGLSLSTSVLLTSIRPRSYSHGAVDGRPHRPILKKVSGL
ncbi:hypothetical protein EGW08_010018 [Elysia chlorotica]|uniref:Uncharacterized protein n=1 Tax=Elysia chlorotica TaxID=188477 RepID=A0A433TKX7_ELYCH|nr:hypothetical protein EGW08_010018 [Elysia chlorotica]